MNITVEKTVHSKLQEIDINNVVFGKNFADHMFVAKYENNEWRELKIMPFKDLTISPACAALHYGQAIFEGMKAYKDSEGTPLLFRPLENLKRLNKSAKRLAMPELPEEIFMAGLKKLIEIDSNWIPTKAGYSLYVRPFMFAHEPVLGVRPADEYTFIIFTSPVGAYYPEPIDVKIETHFSRSMPGGVGAAKAAGNYAASLYPALLGQAEGYKQLVWTDSSTHSYIEESGTMNIMFQINDTLVTPPTSDTILSGITRKSVLSIARHLGIELEERSISVEEIVKGFEEGTIKDAFGIGTAATIAPIQSITHNDKKYQVSNERKYSSKISSMLQAIKLRESEDPFGWVVEI